jgi:predicted  nucleic acid-binding Zn-ribbon protein
MSKHEHYQEICAVASIGQASGAELAELQQHMLSCPECRQRYSDFMEIQANHYAVTKEDPELSATEATACIDSALLRERFFKRAESQGIVFSHAGTETTLPEPLIRLFTPKTWPVLVARTAAAVFLAGAVALSGYYLGGWRLHPGLLAKRSSASQDLTHAGTDVQQLQSRLATLEAANLSLTTKLESLKSSYARTSSAFAQLQDNNAVAEKERSALSADLKGRDETIDTLQKRVEESQAAVANVRAELERAQGGRVEDRANLIESQVRIHDLSEQLAEKSTALEREKELLAAGRDVRELMAARNLHIVDVFDTDRKGKTRPAFGRIFLTEGKSLIFYAYDLNDARVQSAGYHYRVWGKREGPSQRAKSLGIFYSDDKSQTRWVLQYDDPKVLQEIDSVFVTLEPPNGNQTEPKGDKLMYAYLRGQANHP